MIRYLRNILYLLPLVLASCIFEDAPGDCDSQGQVQVTFTLATGNARAVTRAEGPTWGDDYDNQSGTDFETAIKPGDLSVWFYDTDNTPVAQVENLAYSRNDDGQSYTYHGTLTADENILESGGTYKLMVMANCGNPELSDNFDPSDLTFRYDVDYIPMWGVHTIEDLELEAGVNKDLGTVDLLRAMSKIEITLDESIRGDYSFDGATLDRYNEEGYCMPAVWSSVENTTELNRENENPQSFFPKSSLNKGGVLPFDKTDDEGTLVCYVPEYAHDESNPASLTITIDGKEYTLGLKNYHTDSGEYYDLVRNHIYRYNITDVFDGVLTVNYKVMKWEDPIESEIEYSDQVGWQLVPWGVIYDYDLVDRGIGDPDTRFGVLTYPTYNDTDHNTLKPESSIIEFGFHYPKPVGTVWTVHLSNTQDFELVTDSGYSTTGIDRGKTDDATHEMIGMYKIGVRARKAWTSDNSFDVLTTDGQAWEANHTVPSTYLYITISYDGEHQEELVINGIYTGSDQVTNAVYIDNRRFPGTDTRIWIRQLPAKKGWTLQDLAKDIAPGETGYEWWRVNPYWDHDAAGQVQQ